MSEQFAIAVEWPDESRPFLVHLKKPYFVAEARRVANDVVFLATLNSRHVRDLGAKIGELLPEAYRFFSSALGMAAGTAHFVKGNHGREFPRFLMARTLAGKMFIVEPDHPSPLVAVTPPSAEKRKPTGLSQRFDTVTQWRLAQMRKYYQQFSARQSQSEAPSELIVPAM